MPLPDERRSFEKEFACVLIVYYEVEACANCSSLLERQFATHRPLNSHLSTGCARSERQARAG
jgi:hypothetical protein